MSKVGHSVANGADGVGVAGLGVGVGVDPHGGASGVIPAEMSAGAGIEDEAHELCRIVGVGVDDWVG
jgi:hypothetical protein